MGDVYKEVDDIMSKLRVGMHKIKPCSRKYAFELPDIPKEADYLKLMYPYDSESGQSMKARLDQLTLARTGAFDRLKGRFFLKRIWHQYWSLRAVCAMEEYYGTLLAQD